MNNNGIDPNVNNQTNEVNTTANTVSGVNTSSSSVPPVAPVSTPNVDVNNDPGAIVNENVKRVEINYTPPSKFKTFLLIVFFVILIAFVFFLPQISSFVRQFQSGELGQSAEKITNGKMECSLKSQTGNLDKNYFITFTFTDNKLEKVKFSIATRGDANLDEEELTSLTKICNKLSTNVKNVTGVVINCNYVNGELVEEQSFDLEKINYDELNSAFIEAGGNNPQYQYGQDMDGIESNMKSSGYTCERKK